MRYLARLGARAVKASHPVEPRTRSRFEPLAPNLAQAPLEVDEFVDVQGQPSTFVSRRLAPTSGAKSTRAAGPTAVSSPQGTRGLEVDANRAPDLADREEDARAEIAPREAAASSDQPAQSRRFASRSASVSAEAAAERDVAAQFRAVQPVDQRLARRDSAAPQSGLGLEPAAEVATTSHQVAEPAFVEQTRRVISGVLVETGDGAPAGTATASPAPNTIPHADQQHKRGNTSAGPDLETPHLDEPTVTIRIGRIDVRASLPARGEKRSVQPHVESLDEYMRRTATRR